MHFYTPGKRFHIYPLMSYWWMSHFLVPSSQDECPGTFGNDSRGCRKSLKDSAQKGLYMSAVSNNYTKHTNWPSLPMQPLLYLVMKVFVQPRKTLCGGSSGQMPLQAPLSLFAVQEKVTCLVWGWPTGVVWLAVCGVLLMPVTVVRLLSGRSVCRWDS